MSSTVHHPTLLLTPEEAAHELRVGRHKIFDLMRDRDLASVRIGGSRRIPREALRAYIARLAAEQNQPARSVS